VKSLVSLVVAVAIGIAAIYLLAGATAIVSILGSQFPILPAVAAGYFAFTAGVGIANHWVAPPVTFIFVLSIGCSGWALSGRVAGVLPQLVVWLGLPAAVCTAGIVLGGIWKVIAER
jgi:hypothetical protein